jgi:hypothetical protein
MRPLFDPQKEFDIPSMYPVPPGYDGPLFELQNNYPDQSDEDNFPWLSINFEEEPKEYLETLLEYCFKGMPECDFVVKNNQVICSNFLYNKLIRCKGEGLVPRPMDALPCLRP